jgi:rhodanese-related sulfurtransferase
MQKRYIILAFLLIAVAFGLVFLPGLKQKEQIPANIFLNKINESSRFLSTDMIAARIINQDPGLLLVDVRDTEEYEKYSLTGAINIPLSDVLDDDWQGYLDQDVQDVVFYSNDDVLSEKAWALCVQLGYPNLYIMKGGLNEWFATIMQPEMPGETDPSEAFDLYAFRKGASMYFGGSSTDVPEEAKAEKETNKKTIPVRKKVKKEAEGGC